MPRRRQTAAEYIERRDAEMRIILGELAENAVRANLGWAAAVRAARLDPDRALTELVEVEIALDIPVRIERADALRRIRAANRRLDRSRPDDLDRR